MVDAGSWWQALESQESGSDADDARHWVLVYDELIGALALARADFDGDDEGRRRIRERLIQARRRRSYWLRRVRSEGLLTRHPAAGAR